VLALLFLLAGGTANGGGNDLYEIEVYDADTVPARQLLAEQHFNVTHDDGAHLTYELVYGVTSWLEVATYMANQFAPGSHDFGWQEWRLRVRPRTPDGFALRASLNVETVWTADGFESIELRPIWSGAAGRWKLDVAPAVEIDATGGAEFSPELKAAAELGGWIALGVEYFGSWRSGWHQVYGALDVVRWRSFEVNLGVGFGLTAQSDPLVVKSIVGYLF
jgi:hypothetical protein